MYRHPQLGLGWLVCIARLDLYPLTPTSNLEPVSLSLLQTTLRTYHMLGHGLLDELIGVGALAHGSCTCQAEVCDA